MNIHHPGNWRGYGRLVVEGDAPSLDVFECPLCFALTLDPMSHADHHVIHGTDHNVSKRR